MSIVRDTVTAALTRAGLPSDGGQYRRQVSQVVEELETLVTRATDTIRNAARRNGIDPTLVEDVLIEAGLVARPVEVAQAASADSDLTETVRQLVTTVNGLVDLANRNLRSNLSRV